MWIQKAYGQNNMSDFKDRLVEEQGQLASKIEKLGNFLYSDKIKEVTDVQSVLLKIQVEAMITYNECLVLRIENLE